MGYDPNAPLEGSHHYPYPEWFGCNSPAMENALAGALDEVIRGFELLLTKHALFRERYDD